MKSVIRIFALFVASVSSSLDQRQQTTRIV